MARCFLLEPIRADGKAEISADSVRQFGELTILFPFGMPQPPASPSFGVQILSTLKQQKFNPEVDYFIVTGRTARIAVAGMVIVNEFENVGLLIWSDRDNGYVAFRFDPDLTMQVCERLGDGQNIKGVEPLRTR